MSVGLVIIFFYAVMALAMMDLNKETDTILYAKFLTRVEDRR